MERAAAVKNVPMRCSAVCALLFASVLQDGIDPARVRAAEPGAGRTYRNPLIDRIGPADPHVIRYEGRNHLMYSGSGADGPDYAIGYATARSPLGPFTKHSGNPIVRRGDGVFGPGHHCVVTGPGGGMWMVYHQQNGGEIGWQRFLAIDPIEFDAGGVLRAKATRGSDQPAP